MTDESWALSYNDAHSRNNKTAPLFSMPYYMAVSLSFYTMWVFCTALGALIGPVLGDVHQYGFDMAFPAVFLVLVRGMWNGIRKAVPLDNQSGRLRGGMSFYCRPVVRHCWPLSRISRCRIFRGRGCLIIRPSSPSY